MMLIIRKIIIFLTIVGSFVLVKYVEGEGEEFVKMRFDDFVSSSIERKNSVEYRLIFDEILLQWELFDEGWKDLVDIEDRIISDDHACDHADHVVTWTSFGLPSRRDYDERKDVAVMAVHRLFRMQNQFSQAIKSIVPHVRALVRGAFVKQWQKLIDKSCRSVFQP